MTSNNINIANLNSVTDVIPESEFLNTFGTNTIIPPLDPGDTTADAYSLGQINGDISIQQAVGGSDSFDIYAFSVSEAGEYSFSLDGLTADADLRVHDVQENLVDVSELTGNASESLTLQLDQGNYYVSIPSFDGIETNYNLNISNGSNTVNISNPPGGNISEPLETGEPGSTFDTAFDFGTFTNSGNNALAFADAVGGGDETDLFQFTITESQQFSAAIDNLTADADLTLVDSNDQVIASSWTDGIVETESFSTTISPGTYFLGVDSYDGIETNYNLNITSGVDSVETVDISNPPGGNISEPLETGEPGSTFDTAFDFGTFTNSGNNALAFADAVGGGDETDLFQFTITESQQFSAAIDNLTADADLTLVDSNDQVIASSWTDGIVETESFSTTISPGTYFLGVESYDGIETSYNLSITSGASGSIGGGFPPIIPPGGGTGGKISGEPTAHEEYINGVIWERDPITDPTTGETTWVDTSI